MQAGTGLVSQVGLYVGEVGPVTAFLVEGAQQVAVGFVAGSGDPGEALLQGGAFEVGIGTEYAQGGAACRRSEERRVGKECRSRWGRYQYKKNGCVGDSMKVVTE